MMVDFTGKEAPLILTLALDDRSFGFFDGIRKEFFPAERNFIRAHLTLFHHLPPTEPTVLEHLQETSRNLAPFPLNVCEVKSIGKGVAYKIDCPAVVTLHRTLQQTWQQWLTPQDKQKLWPHITVQNKVSVAEAKQTLEKLQATFKPFTAFGTGFGLYAYEGGPWRLLHMFPFLQP